MGFNFSTNWNIFQIIYQGLNTQERAFVCFMLQQAHHERYILFQITVNKLRARPLICIVPIRMNITNEHHLKVTGYQEIRH